MGNAIDEGAEGADWRAGGLAGLFSAALGALEEGVAVLDAKARVVLWNEAAVAISGYQAANMLDRALPDELYRLNSQHWRAQHQASRHEFMPGPEADPAHRQERPVLVILRHSRGHSLPAMLRRVPLRDALGKRFGTLLRFHPVEEIDALPHGEPAGDGAQNSHMEQSQAAMEDRLDEAWQEWSGNGVPFGLLWITVDQAAMLRKTHGPDASEAMLSIVERSLLHGLRPTEILARWGKNEFLVLSHERTGDMLSAHARHVAGMARTAEFRWWGDRVPLTVSIGVAQAEEAASLSAVLSLAQSAMQASMHAGGNHVTGHHTRHAGG